jgi:hypothetical protein
VKLQHRLACASGLTAAPKVKKPELSALSCGRLRSRRRQHRSDESNRGLSFDERARFYFAVYVRSVSRLTPLYMALIDPFRKLVVYPSLLRSVCACWKQTVGAG